MRNTVAKMLRLYVITDPRISNRKRGFRAAKRAWNTIPWNERHGHAVDITKVTTARMAILKGD